jgi:2-hydroxymuconate-semialdehyde hydrolase
MIDLVEKLRLERFTVVGNSMGGMLIKLAFFYNEPTVDAMQTLLTSFVYDTTFNFGAAPPVSFTPESLARIMQRVLIIHGRDDTAVSNDNSLYFAAHIPNADLHIIARCGHWTQIEHPKRFCALLDLFVSEQFRETRP